MPPFRETSAKLYDQVCQSAWQNEIPFNAFFGRGNLPILLPSFSDFTTIQAGDGIPPLTAPVADDAYAIPVPE
jgi:hypothetical protein